MSVDEDVLLNKLVQVLVLMLGLITAKRPKWKYLDYIK